AELASLTRYDLVAPSLDPEAFPGVAEGEFWTSTPAGLMGESAFVVSHGDGTITRNMKLPNATASTWCVHDLKPSPDVECARYSFADGEQSVRDAETGLVWQRVQQPNGMKTWADAKVICSALPIGGHPWRLPEVSELVSLLDVTGQTPPKLDAMFFGGEPTD